MPKAVPSTTHPRQPVLASAVRAQAATARRDNTATVLTGIQDAPPKEAVPSATHPRRPVLAPAVSAQGRNQHDVPTSTGAGNRLITPVTTARRDPTASSAALHRGRGQDQAVPSTTYPCQPAPASARRRVVRPLTKKGPIRTQKLRSHRVNRCRQDAPPESSRAQHDAPRPPVLASAVGAPGRTHHDVSTLTGASIGLIAPVHAATTRQPVQPLTEGAAKNQDVSSTTYPRQPVHAPVQRCANRILTRESDRTQRTAATVSTRCWQDTALQKKAMPSPT